MGWLGDGIVGRMISWARLFWAAALMVIIVGTLLPGTSAPPTFDLNDKLIHFTGYFGLGLLGATGWPPQRLSFLVTMPLLGFVLEIMQGTLVPGRHFDMGDALANALGAAVGVAVSIALMKLVSPHENSGASAR